MTSPRSPHHNRARTQLEIPGTPQPPTTLDDSPAWQLWRPVGWRGGATPEATYLLGREAEEKAKKNLPLTLDDEVALHNLALLRDCYNTPTWVWEIASGLAEVDTWETDPFWNPSAVGAAAKTSLKLDGSEGRDGLATDSTGAPLWRGPTLVNGPHSDPAAWVRLCSIHGRDNPVAAVVPCDGVKWYREIGLTADLEVALGRLNYEAPPGLPPRQSSPRASSLLLWIPHLRNEIRAGRWYAEPIAWRIDHAPRRPVVIVRRAFAGAVDIFDWISDPVEHVRPTPPKTVQPTPPKTDPRLQQVLDALHENYSSMVTNARPVSGGWEIRISSGALAAVVTIYTSGRATTGGKDTSLRRDARSILEGLGYDVKC